MHMTDAEIRERSTLTLLRIIARQEGEIERLRKTLASTAQVAAEPTITPDSLRRLADGLANQNSEAERIAARYAASADLLDALKEVKRLFEYRGDDATAFAAKVEAEIVAAIAKAERAEP